MINIAFICIFHGSHWNCSHVREEIAKSLPGSWDRLFTNEPLFFKSIFKAPGKSCHPPRIVSIGSALKYFPRTKTLLSDAKCVSLYRSKQGSKNPGHELMVLILWGWFGYWTPGSMLVQARSFKISDSFWKRYSSISSSVNGAPEFFMRLFDKSIKNLFWKFQNYIEEDLQSP